MSFQKHLLIAVTFIVGASCQIYTQAGPDGYKYPKPIARLDVPQTVEEPSVIKFKSFYVHADQQFETF